LSAKWDNASPWRWSGARLVPDGLGQQHFSLTESENREEEEEEKEAEGRKKPSRSREMMKAAGRRLQNLCLSL
jgi:hypothetical protein